MRVDTDVPQLILLQKINNNDNHRMKIQPQNSKYMLKVSTVPDGLVFSQRLADINQIWLTLKANYHERLIIIARFPQNVQKEVKDLQGHLVYYDGPHYKGFQEIQFPENTDSIIASSMSMTIRIVADMDEVKDSGLTDVILLYKGLSTPGLPHDKLDLEGHERNMHVLLTPKHQACRQLKSVMMLCAFKLLHLKAAS